LFAYIANEKRKKMNKEGKAGWKRGEGDKKVKLKKII
jgi:hypothetical protein